MTAQIFLFNQRGVVVASDTLSCRRLAPTGWARFPSNSKICSLGEGHRVVVTTSGQATIAKIHDELLLREWIASLSEPLASLDAYADDFTRWAGVTLHSLEFDDLTFPPATGHMVMRLEVDDRRSVVPTRSEARCRLRSAA